VEALKLAFDTIIVGALALPWLAMGIYLFLGSQDGRMAHFGAVFRENQAQVPPAVAAVFLFAAAYFFGAAVSRVSGDFFNDEDLSVPVTENGIRARVYCNASGLNLLDLRFPTKEDAPFPVTAQSFEESCKMMDAKGPPEPCTANAPCRSANQLAERIFQLQESALLMQGGDRLERLNQLHAQIMVLRGAAFNGIIMCAFCLFGMCANQRARNRIVWIIPIVFLVVGAMTLWRHYRLHWSLDDPPFMECAFLSLGLVAVSAVWKGVPLRPYATYFLLSMAVSGVACFGWWWSEVLYDQQVLQSFYVQTHHLLTLTQ
jgi:hypothetical protein